MFCRRTKRCRSNTSMLSAGERARLAARTDGPRTTYSGRLFLFPSVAHRRIKLEDSKNGELGITCPSVPSFTAATAEGGGDDDDRDVIFANAVIEYTLDSPSGGFLFNDALTGYTRAGLGFGDPYGTRTWLPCVDAPPRATST